MLSIKVISYVELNQEKFSHLRTEKEIVQTDYLLPGTDNWSLVRQIESEMREELRFDRYSDNLTCACLEYSVQLREVLREHVHRNHFLCASTPTLESFIVMFFFSKKVYKNGGLWDVLLVQRRGALLRAACLLKVMNSTYLINGRLK